MMRAKKEMFSTFTKVHTLKSHVPICKGVALVFLLFCYRLEILLKRWNHYVNKYSIHVSSVPYFTSF